MSQSRFPKLRRRRPSNRRITAARLGDLIRFIRRGQGWSIRDAARYLGVNRSSIQRAETESEHYIGAAVRTLIAMHTHLHGRGRHPGVEVRFDFAPELQGVIDDFLEPDRAALRASITEGFGDPRIEWESDPERVYVLTTVGRVVVDLDERWAYALKDGANARRTIQAAPGEPDDSFAARVHELIDTMT